jgi:hypothetical protein
VKRWGETGAPVVTEERREWWSWRKTEARGRCVPVTAVAREAVGDKDAVEKVLSRG